MTLLLELTVWHIPSVASSVNIFQKENDLKKYYSSKFQQIFEWPILLKVAIFVIPLILIYIAYFIPIVFVFSSEQLSHEDGYLIAMIGVALILIGRLISFNYIFTIRKQNRQKDNSFTLHTGGMFGFSRNPGLLGLYISFIGFLCIIQQLFFLALLLVYFAHMHFKVLMEEDFLKNKFHPSYMAYFKKSKRYI